MRIYTCDVMGRGGVKEGGGGSGGEGGGGRRGW